MRDKRYYPNSVAPGQYYREGIEDKIKYKH